ncbi:MAG: hypothetical protein JSS66_07000 [Armatimonadetes bacterium]|nr:hypothetical protein [Armatimonadota bacterium]
MSRSRRAVLTSTHYSNIRMLSPDGILMCRLSARRARWYLDHGLASPEGEDAIRLTFEPNGLGANGHTFYTSAHEDQCVVCGRPDALSRHHCVPYCFRRHFPDDYKVHNWHDIVLLCDECHNGYEVVAQSVKNSLLKVPADELAGRKNTLRAIKVAHTLATHIDRIPTDKIVEMRQYLAEFLGLDTVTDDQIVDLALTDRPCLLSDDDWKRIVDDLDDIDGFVRWWRQHFVDIMEPRYLPTGWSVDSPASRKEFDQCVGR